MGYIPNSHARILTTKKSWTIGILFDEKLNVGMKHPFFSAVLESFKKNVEKQEVMTCCIHFKGYRWRQDYLS
ncbi:MAG: hypothetical protein KatS3mg079_263 [Caloramator sp.]|nr:MAG: hypothetical protein KatS3mg079_263 [Caloramator sp.]